VTRTPAYYVMRVCERWGWREGEFCQLPWEEQVRLLAWERVRMEEDKG
jgi:hypothetical protein